MGNTGKETIEYKKRTKNSAKITKGVGEKENSEKIRTYLRKKELSSKRRQDWMLGNKMKGHRFAKTNES